VGLYNFRLKHTPIRKVLLWTALAGGLLGLTQLMLVTGELRLLCCSLAMLSLVPSVASVRLCRRLCCVLPVAVAQLIGHAQCFAPAMLPPLAPTHPLAARRSSAASLAHSRALSLMGPTQLHCLQASTASWA
jgi:hypothetical protein